MCLFSIEEGRKKLQKTMQRTKEDAEKRRQEMLEKIREEAEELDRSRVKAEEERTRAQQVRRGTAPLFRSLYIYLHLSSSSLNDSLLSVFRVIFSSAYEKT